MKKIFLLFGIAAFCSASAQQKDVFDIQKHLNQLVKDKKFPGAVFKPFNKTRPLINYYGYPLYSQNLSHILPNGDKVYTLSQDNMPCIVPDMKQFNNMPDISNPNEYFELLQFRNHVPGTIPNAVRPYRLIASK